MPLFPREMFGGVRPGSRPSGPGVFVVGKVFLFAFRGEVFKDALSFPRGLFSPAAFSGSWAFPSSLSSPPPPAPGGRPCPSVGCPGDPVLSVPKGQFGGAPLFS